MPIKTAALLIALAAPAAAHAAKATLPLRHGTYVRHGTPCADPPFAAMRSWDGIGLADPHSHACRARVLARRGSAYLIDNSCIGTGIGPGARTSERLTIVPLSAGMRISGDRYDFCPAAALPPELRKRTSR